MPRLGHRPALDALRGVAVVSIVTYHADPDWFPLAPASLDVFFVLSTFLVTTLLLEALGRHGSTRPRRFLTRRVRRLAAGLAAMLAVVLALASLGAYLNPDVGRTAVGAALLHANTAQFGGDYFTAFADRNPLEHTWSLSVEEHFYLVILAAVGLSWLATRRSVTRTRVALGVLAAAMALGSVLLSRHLLASGAGPNRIYMGSDTRAVAAAAGMGLAVVVHGRWDLPGRAGRLVSVAGWALAIGVVLATVLRVHPTLEWYASGGWALTAAGAAVVVAAATRSRTSGRISGNPVLQWTGRRSYGIYLWHLPLLVLAADHGAPGLLAALAATAIAAELSHRFVEQRFRTGWLPDRAVLPTVGAGFAALAVLALAVPAPELPTWAAEPVAARSEAPPEVPTVADRGSDGDAAAATVTTPAPEPMTLLVWGDGAAAMLAEQMGADSRFAVQTQFESCDGPGSCAHAVPTPTAIPDGGEPAAVVIAVADLSAFHSPIVNPWDMAAPERRAAELWTRLVAAVGDRPVVLAMPPDARRDLGVGLHLRRMVSDGAANLVLDAEPQGWPDAIADRFAPDTAVPKVLVVGDSVAYSLATAFRPEGTVVWDQSRHGCDPSPGDRVTIRNGRDRTASPCDWRADWARAVQQWDPDTVVWHTGTWSTYDRVVDGEHLAVGSPGWHDAVAAAHSEAMGILGASGAEVVVAVTAPAWETAPGKPVETGPEESARRTPVLLDAVRAAAVQHPRVTVLDTADVLCDPGCDRPELRDDGVHYTPEGARLVSAWITERLPLP